MPRKLTALASCVGLTSRTVCVFRVLKRDTLHLVTRIDLEEIAQRPAPIATPKPVGAQTRHRMRHILRDAFRQRFEVIARRHHDIALARQLLRDERQFRLVARMQQVVTLGLDAIAIQLLIRSHAPHVRRHAVFGQQSLRFDDLDCFVATASRAAVGGARI